MVNHCECQGFSGREITVSQSVKQDREGAAGRSRSQEGPAEGGLPLQSRIVLSQAVRLGKHRLVSAHLCHFGVHFLLLKLSPSFHIF